MFQLETLLESVSYIFYICSIILHRPWHDAQAIAHTCAINYANQEKGGMGG